MAVTGHDGTWARALRKRSQRGSQPQLAVKSDALAPTFDNSTVSVWMFERREWRRRRRQSIALTVSCQFVIRWRTPPFPPLLVVHARHALDDRLLLVTCGVLMAVPSTLNIDASARRNGARARQQRTLDDAPPAFRRRFERMECRSESFVGEQERRARRNLVAPGSGLALP
jgi:hypothetical protein